MMYIFNPKLSYSNFGELTFEEKPKISVIGAGYVGLCTAVGFASKGYSVISSDVDAEKVAKINRRYSSFS